MSGRDVGGTGAVRLRELGPSDIAPVAAIEAEVNPSPWSASLFAGELELDPAARYWLVAVLDDGRPGQGTVVGFAGFAVLADVAHVLDVGVDPAHQRRGIGSRLCRAVMDEAWRRGVSGVTLEVRRSNAAARALYRGLGMTESGLRPRYYPDGECAVIFWARPSTVE